MWREHVGWLTGAFALLVMIAGCGSPSGVAEKSTPPAMASEMAAPATKTTESATLKASQVAKAVEPAAKPTSGSSAAIPVAQPPAKPTAPVAPAEPVDTRQLAKVLDLSKLPAPEGATIGQNSATLLQVGVLLSVPSATEFYLGKLQALGWRRVGDPASSTVTESFAQVSLGKDGYQLSLTVMSGKPKEASVTIVHVGNLDTRTLPRVDGAEDQYSCQASSLYFTSAKVDEATASLRRLLTAAGWQEYDRAFSQKADRPDASDLLFRKKAYSLAVSISRSPAQPTKTAVQYYVSTFAHDLPAPADARHVEIQDSRWILMCEVPRDPAAAAEYYRTAMQEIGFPARPHETSSGKALALSFESQEHDIVLVNLQAADEHTTKVKLEGYSAAFREAMKKAAAEARVKQELQQKAEAQAKAERVRAFEAASKRQDDMINAAIGNVLSESTQPTKQTELSKSIQADVKAKINKAFRGAAADDLANPDDPPVKKPQKPMPK